MAPSFVLALLLPAVLSATLVVLALRPSAAARSPLELHGPCHLQNEGWARAYACEGDGHTWFENSPGQWVDGGANTPAPPTPRA